VTSLRPPLTEVHPDERLSRAAIDELLDGPRHFNVAAMAQRGWCVAPMPDSVGDDVAERLAAAAGKLGIDHGVAATTEPAVFEEQFSVPMTPDGIIAFDLSCHLRCFLLLPPRREFALLHEANFYWLLAGTEHFIREVLHVSASEAIGAFLDDYVGRSGWPPETLNVLQEVRRYQTLCRMP
jgi:hypothetical protein